MTAASNTRRGTATYRLGVVGAAVAAGLLLVSGCNDHTKDSSSGSAGKSGGCTAKADAPLFCKLPAKYRSSGVIKVGTDATYAPMETTTGGAITGIDPEIGAALGKELGVKFQFSTAKFDTLITSVYDGRNDIVMSSMSDTKQREQGLDDKGKKAGAGLDFVDYFESGVSMLVKKGNPENVQTLPDLCGKTVAVQRGTIYETTFQNQAKKCPKAKKLRIESFDTDAEAQTRVKAGGAVADLNDYPVAAYIAKTTDGGKAFQVAGQQLGAGPFGIAVAKSNTGLRDALKAAVNAIIQDGTYHKILTKWQVTNSAIPAATINSGS
jgi:polar amino acid transport system substrate-binding protein